MIVKNNAEQATLMAAGGRLADILDILTREAIAGKSGLFLEEMAKDLAKRHEVRPSFLGYEGFPAALCVSVNDCLVHGIPNARPFQEGDVVSLDFGLEYPAKNGFYVDMAVTVIVGQGAKEVKKLVETTRFSLEAGIAEARLGNCLGDIGFAVECVVKEAGLGLVRKLVGHGVGRFVHEPPQVPNFGKKGAGEKLVAGLVLAIEPMVSLGTGDIRLADDKFAYVTADGSWSAHFEHTVLITAAGPLIATQKRVA